MRECVAILLRRVLRGCRDGTLPAAFCVCFAAALSVVSGPAAAQGQTVRFCFNEWAPYAFRQNDAFVGISIDAAAEAAKRSGYDAAFVELPWNRCLQSVTDAENDAVLDAASRDAYLQGPNSYSVYSNTFWVRRDSELPRSLDFEALSGSAIGLVDGYEYPASVLASLERAGVRIDFAVDDAANLRKLAFGRVDAIIADRASGAWAAMQQGLAIRALDPDHSADALYLSFNPERQEMQRRIDAAIGAMLADGAIAAIYRKYLGRDFDSRPGAAFRN